jgi:hypothetical protein
MLEPQSQVGELTRIVDNVRRMVRDGKFVFGFGVVVGAQRELDHAARGLGLRVVIDAAAPYSQELPGLRLDVESRRDIPRIYKELVYRVDEAWLVSLTGRTCVKHRYCRDSVPGSGIDIQAAISARSKGPIPFAPRRDVVLVSVSDPPAVDRSRFPHSCPRCGSPAYVGLASAECSRAGCV